MTESVSLAFLRVTPHTRPFVSHVLQEGQGFHKNIIFFFFFTAAWFYYYKYTVKTVFFFFKNIIFKGTKLAVRKLEFKFHFLID